MGWSWLGMVKSRSPMKRVLISRRSRIPHVRYRWIPLVMRLNMSRLSVHLLFLWNRLASYIDIMRSLRTPSKWKSNSHHNLSFYNPQEVSCPGTLVDRDLMFKDILEPAIVQWWRPLLYINLLQAQTWDNLLWSPAIDEPPNLYQKKGWTDTNIP